MRSDARANRDRILAAAEEVFGELGATGSTEDVARRAGVGVATVFRHFPTKRDLLGATVVRHFEHLTSYARAAGSEPEAGAAFRALLSTMTERGAGKIVMLGLLIDAGGFTEGALRASAALRTEVDASLRRAQGAGAIRTDVTVDDVYLLIRGLSLAAAHPSIEPSATGPALRVVLDGLAAGAAAPRPAPDATAT
ncbi:TetR/AcrR family transcriptional regulator [Micromonospora sp. DT31]|uniref:TetR/AcrR family transcriptional regulator n=1 Tax=Micromonospora sp. DT31 TaxID=3393434 RepID=UPI003CF3A830